MNEETKDKINELKKKGWLDVWFAFDVLGVNQEIVEQSLGNHISKLEKLSVVFIYNKEFKTAEKVETPPKGVEEAWSKVIELKLFIKSFTDLINIIYLYGPSAIEILSPNSKELKLEELQDIANTMAGLMHQFAAAGAGGIVITPK
ncbi:MAG: hypothetical protein HZB65_04755 [Candidatus Aenigmarchaeota archaeon]|nr:hypothetical protein [Candidatus Aenigmarchaeota archaeon]